MDKKQIKSSIQLLGKLADKALASLPGIIGSIISWILNRAKEVVGCLRTCGHLSQVLEF